MQAKSSAEDSVPVLLEDIFLLLDCNTQGYVQKNNIPTIGTFSKSFFDGFYIQRNGQDILRKSDFLLKFEEADAREDWIVDLRRKIYLKHWNFLPRLLTNFFLKQRCKNIASKNEDSNPSKSFFSAVQSLVSTVTEALDHVTDIILVFQIYQYAMDPLNKGNPAYAILFLIRLLAISSNYLISYSSAIQLLLFKGIFDPSTYKTHSKMTKGLLSLFFTFLGPLYFLFLTVFDILYNFLNNLLFVFVWNNQKLQRALKYVDSLIPRVLGLENHEYEAFLSQRSMVQLMFQDLPVLITDTLLLAKVLDAPLILQNSLPELVISYILTVNNIFKQFIMLKIDSSSLKEDFLNFCFISMKAKFGWIPFLQQLKRREAINKVINYEKIRCALPVVTPLLGIYHDLSIEFSETSIRHLIDVLTVVKNNQDQKEVSWEIAFGDSLSRVPIGVLLQLISSSPKNVILNFEKTPWIKSIEYSRKLNRIPINKEKKWEAVTPLREGMLNICLAATTEKGYQLYNLLELLLEEGADPDTSDAYGERVLLLAVKKKDINLIKLLLKYGASVNFDSLDKTTCPLSQAIENCDVEIIKMLIENGADIHRTIVWKNMPMTILTKIITIIHKDENTEADLETINMLVNLATSVCVKTPEEKDTLLAALGNQAARNRRKSMQVLCKLISDKDSFIFHQDTYGRTFLHYYLKDAEGCYLELFSDDEKAFKTMLEIRDKNGDRPYDYYLRQFGPENGFQVAQALFGLRWGAPGYEQSSMDWAATCIKINDIGKLERIWNVRDSQEYLQKLFKKNEVLAQDKMVAKIINNKFGEILKIEETVKAQPSQQQSNEHTNKDPNNKPFDKNMPEEREGLQQKIQDELEDARFMLEKDPTKNNIQTKSAHKLNFFEPVLQFLLEVSSIFDLVTDIIVVIGLMSAGHVAWGSISVLTMVVPYLISYAPLITFFIERDGFVKTGDVISKLNGMAFGLFFLTPLCMVYLFIMDFVYALSELLLSTLNLIFFILTWGKTSNTFETFVNEKFSSVFKLNQMDLKGLRRLRTISQVIFETIPQMIMQIRILAYDSEMGVTTMTIVISFILAVAHLLLETALLYNESVASKANLRFYSIICLNGRLDWVPFIEKMTRAREEKDKVLNYDAMEYEVLNNKFKMDYEFNNTTIKMLSQCVSQLPTSTNKPQQMELILGGSCKRIDFYNLLLLIRMSKDKINLKYEGLDWNHIFENTVFEESEMEKHIQTLIEYECAPGLKHLFERNQITTQSKEVPDNSALYALAIQKNSLEVLKVLMDFRPKANKLEKHQNIISGILDQKNVELMKTFFGHVNMGLSSSLRNKVFMIATDFIKEGNQKSGEELINLIGGFRTNIKGKNLRKIALDEDKKETLNLLETWEKELPASMKICLTFRDNMKGYFDRNLIEKFKTLRMNLPGQKPIGIEIAQGKECAWGSKDQPYDLGVFKVDSKIFMHLYRLLMTGKLHSKFITLELRLLDDLVKILALDETMLHQFYSSTAFLRGEKIIHMNYQEYLRIVPSSGLPTPDHIIDNLDVRNRYVNLVSESLASDILMIKNVKFNGVVADQGFGGTGLSELLIYARTPLDAFRDPIVLVDRNKHSGNNYNLIYDGKDNCMDIQTIHIVPGTILEVWLMAHGSDGWSAQTEGFEMSLECITTEHKQIYSLE